MKKKEGSSRKDKKEKKEKKEKRKRKHKSKDKKKVGCGGWGWSAAGRWGSAGGVRGPGRRKRARALCSAWRRDAGLPLLAAGFIPPRLRPSWPCPPQKHTRSSKDKKSTKKRRHSSGSDSSSSSSSSSSDSGSSSSDDGDYGGMGSPVRLSKFLYQ